MKYLGAALIALVAGCASPGDAHRPLPVTTLPAACAKPVDTLLVLMPGAYDEPKDFVSQGFVDAVRTRHIAADVVIVNATMPYYRERTLVSRLETDVLAPARARGIRHVWLGGISLGGMGSLIVANEKRGAVDGLLLVAPYLGEQGIVSEVAAAGALATWTPPAPAATDGPDVRIWRWLKELTASGRPPVVLGYGVDDRFAAAHRLLAQSLPSDRVATAPGGHDWSAWRAVWGPMLDASALPRDPGCR